MPGAETNYWCEEAAALGNAFVVSIPVSAQ